MTQAKITQVLVLFNGLLLLLFISLLGCYYRLVPEDYFAVWGNHEYGPWKQAIVVCNQWGGRFFSYLFSFVLLSLTEKGFSYAWYFLAGNVMIILSFNSILTYISNRYTTPFSATEIFLTALVGFNCLFYLTPGIHESWFWMGASPSYYWGLVMAVTGSALLIRKNTRWYHVMLSSCCFLYTCSASEPFALMILFFFTVYFCIYRYVKNGLPGFYFFLPLIFALAGFALMFFSKGTHDRWLAMPDLTLPIKLKRLAGAVAKYYIYYFPVKSLLSLALAPVLFAAGNRLRQSKIVLPKIRFSRFCLLIFTAYTGILLLSFAPSCFVMGEAGPLRSWHHIGLYHVVFVFIFFIFMGYHFDGKIKISKNFLAIYLIFITCFQSYFLASQVMVAKHYTKSVDERIALLNELKSRNFKGSITLKKLPDPGYLFPAEIGNDPDDFRNQFLKKGMGLDFDISLEEK